jgi:hypothetical protein
MTPERYKQINDKGKGLTVKEYNEGWHFCPEWDLLLIGPGMEEMKSCTCYHRNYCPTCED